MTSTDLAKQIRRASLALPINHPVHDDTVEFLANINGLALSATTPEQSV